MYIKQNSVYFMVSRYIHKVITVVISNMFIETIQHRGIYNNYNIAEHVSKLIVTSG